MEGETIKKEEENNPPIDEILKKGFIGGFDEIVPYLDDKEKKDAIPKPKTAPVQTIGKEVVPVTTKEGEVRQTGKEEVYAYTVKEAAFGEFKILNSANAWWIDPIKVNRLIDAYKIDCTDEQARFYAGITRPQLEYFQKLHPEFSAIKRLCGEHLALIAKSHIAKEIEGNKDGRPSWYLERIEKKRYGTKIDVTSDDQPINPGGEALIAANVALTAFLSEKAKSLPEDKNNNVEPKDTGDIK